MFRYSVRYRRSTGSASIHRLTVTARDADEARAKAAIQDPEYGSTVESPRRGSIVATFDAPRRRDPEDPLPCLGCGSPDPARIEGRRCSDCFDFGGLVFK